jgi:HrpA-like RNA helicase
MREGEGAVLVFLPGWEDICRLARILEESFTLQVTKILAVINAVTMEI